MYHKDHNISTSSVSKSFGVCKVLSYVQVCLMFTIVLFLGILYVPLLEAKEESLELILPADDSSVELIMKPPLDDKKTSKRNVSNPSDKEKAFQAEVLELDAGTFVPFEPDETYKDIVEILNQSPPDNILIPEFSAPDKISIEKKVDTRELCRRFEGRLVSYYDRVATVENCRLRFIDDAELINLVAVLRNTSPLEISVEVYKKLPAGKPYTYADYLKEQGRLQGRTLSREELCKTLDGMYVTDDAEFIAYVEKCKLRPFLSFYDFSVHNKKNLPLVSLAPQELALIPEGHPMPSLADQDLQLLLQLDDSAVLQQLQKRETQKETTPEFLSQKVQRKEKTPRRTELCAHFEKKFVGFFSQVFLIVGCKKSLIKELSPELQLVIEEEQGGIIDLTQNEYKSFPDGRDLTPEEALRYVRQQSPKS